MKNIKKLLCAISNVTNIPTELINQLRYSVSSLEHPVFHPERFLLRHIDVTVGRAYKSQHRYTLCDKSTMTLLCAALLHDITKSGFCPSLWNGRVGNQSPLGYWSNKDHDSQAIDFIDLPQITSMLKALVDGGHIISIQMVKDLCVNHMNVKKGLQNHWGFIRRGTKSNADKHPTPFVESVIGADYMSLSAIFSTYIDNMRIDDGGDIKKFL